MKKITSLILAALLVFGLASTIFAANGTYTLNLGYSGNANTGQLLTDSVGTIYPGHEIHYYIYLDGAKVTRTTIRSDKIDVKARTSQGSKALDSYSIKYDSNGHAYVNVKFVNPFVSTKELDFNITLYLIGNKSRIAGTELDIVGTLENYMQEADENDEYVNLYDWPLVEALDYIKSIEVDLGQGLSIHTKMFQDKKYYGYVHQEIKAVDDDVITKYPSIDTVYYLQTINLNSSGNYVTMDLDRKYYIYNADLQYIGTSNDKLPYSTKYYVSSVELDLGDAPLIDDVPFASATGNVPSGGDVPKNINNNPGSGQ